MCGIWGVHHCSGIAYRGIGDPELIPARTSSPTLLAALTLYPFSCPLHMSTCACHILSSGHPVLVNAVLPLTRPHFCAPCLIVSSLVSSFPFCSPFLDMLLYFHTTLHLLLIPHLSTSPYVFSCLASLSARCVSFSQCVYESRLNNNQFDSNSNNGAQRHPGHACALCMIQR
jgi:hypothetical protein